MQDHELTTIEGIGASTAQKLVERGIATLVDLGQADFSEIEDIRGADVQWILDAYNLTLPAEVFVEPEPSEGEAVPRVESYVPHSVITLAFGPAYAEKLQSMRDTFARKKNDQSLTIENAIWIAIENQMKEFGIA